jgi:hypothetical protein
MLNKEQQPEYGPQPPPTPQQFLTTKGLIIRAVIFAASLGGACYFIWQEFSR